MELFVKVLRLAGMCLLAIVLAVAGFVCGFVEGLVKGLAPLPGEIVEAFKDGCKKGQAKR